MRDSSHISSQPKASAKPSCLMALPTYTGASKSTQYVKQAALHKASASVPKISTFFKPQHHNPLTTDVIDTAGVQTSRSKLADTENNVINVDQLSDLINNAEFKTSVLSNAATEPASTDSDFLSRTMSPSEASGIGAAGALSDLKESNSS